MMTPLYMEKLACSWFFVAPSLAYGLFTSRLPAIRQAVKADDSQIATLLLGLGLSTLCALLASDRILEKFGARKATAFAIIWLVCGITLLCLALSFWQILVCAVLTGFGVGLCDVGMNAMGLALEKRSGKYCMSFLHAVSGLGGVAGAVSGSLFAARTLSPFANAALVLGLYLCVLPFAWRRLGQSPEIMERRTGGLGSLPLFVFVCGVLGLICHIAEGSVGSWGSVFLHSVKGAPQDEAALAFAMFTGALVASRFFADWFRSVLGDFLLMLGGSLFGAAGMALVLLASNPLICLVGYAVMGFGLGPVVPILFSRAGAAKGVTTAQASALVSIFSYAGLLFFPPFLGYLAKTVGLAPSLWLIVALCLIQALGAAAFLKRRV
ncbi:MAG: MFS transporter [Desulfovibrio sp.]|nr:MFS transporter [Desulfovibrio sp.]